MRTLLRDARFGLRQLRRSPGTTFIAILALSLGIAANTAIFSVVYATLLAPMPYPEPDQLVMVWSRIQGNRNVSAAATYLAWKEQSTAFQRLSAWTGRGVNLASAEKPEQVSANVATPGFASMIGYPFALGRDFLPEEGTPGRDSVVILSNQLWHERFADDLHIVGRQIRIDGTPHTVVGVLAPGTTDRLQNKLYLPLAFKPEQINHDFHFLLVMGRLKPGVTLAQANENMKAVATNIARAFPVSNKGWGASVEPLKNNFLSKETTTGLWLLLGAVGFVLLIACANVANLLLARGSARQREIAVRASMGASRARLFRQFITESVVLAGIGGLLGVGLASLMLDGLLAMMPPFTLPSEADVRLNVPVLLFTLLVSMLSGVLFGCIPAWQASRANLNETLKDGGRSTVGGRHRLRQALVAIEFALALTLLAGGGLAIHSLIKLSQVELGFHADHLLTFGVPVANSRFPEVPQLNAFYRQLLERIQAVPGVVSVSASTGMPVQGTGFGMPFFMAGKPVADPSQRPSAGFNMVTADYYKTFVIPITRGRAFTDQDGEASVRVAIVNQAFVTKYMKDVDPLKQRIVVEQLIPGVTKLGPAVEWQIVGVYGEVHNAGPGGITQDGVRGGDYPEIDVPFAQSPWPGSGLAVRTAGSPDAVRNSIAAVVRGLDPDLPLVDVKSMEQLVTESISGDRFNALLFGSFAALAMLLAALGIYGVMSFVVAQRTHEIGLRMALGAGRGRVIRQVIREGMATALIGVVVGSAGAYGVGRAMQGLWFGVGAIDPVGFSVVATTLLVAALLACVVPARRAASVDPMVALRQD
jgi:putative ABC transport system permease protein